MCRHKKEKAICLRCLKETTEPQFTEFSLSNFYPKKACGQTAKDMPIQPKTMKSKEVRKAWVAQKTQVRTKEFTSNATNTAIPFI